MIWSPREQPRLPTTRLCIFHQYFAAAAVQQQHKRRHSSLPHFKLFCPKTFFVRSFVRRPHFETLALRFSSIHQKSAMISHSYAIDSQSKAQELASTILTSSSPSTISAACTAIETFLHKHTADQIRSFFSIAFPPLISKIFGFDDSSSSTDKSRSWIDQINGSNDLELAGKLYNLLSPYGILFSSISSVDRHSLVKYVFPIERLPEWSRFLLQNERDCRVLSDLCPLFKGRIKEDSSKGGGCYHQVQLNVFEYYMFWFAYYPVCKGNSENSDVVVVRKTRRFRLENWTTSFPILSGANRGGLGKKTECSLYIRLLYAYLRAYVPNYGCTAHQPYRSSLLHYSSGFDGSALLQVEFVVHTLIHFWLVDNDFSPLPVSVCKSFGVSFPLRAVLGETPPTSGLGEVVMLFMKYLNRSFAALKQEYEVVEHSGSPRWRVSGGSVDVVKSKAAVSQSSSSVASWNSLIQRPMYRFILRTFLFCPMGTSIKNASQVFSLWISYMEPWKISLEDFVELEALIDPSTGNLRNEKAQSSVKNIDSRKSCQSAHEYTSSWEAYVLSNYLFYSSLVMHFLGFAHKFLHTDPETIIRMVSKVLTILTSSKELMALLKKVDAAFHSKQALPSSPRFDNLYKCVPSIREQLQDWEEGLCESDADGSFLHENWNQDLRLLSDGEDGGYQLLQLLILRAESEIQAIAGDHLSQNLQMLDSLKADMGHLFGAHVERPRSVTPDTKQTQHSRDELFKPRWVGNQSFADVKYKGDWMKRPASDGEVAWLANLMVRLSDYLNKILGLNQGQNSNMEGPAWSYVDVSNNGMSKVGGPKEAMKMLVSCVGSWLVLVGVSLVKFMREHGLRLNLRVFASKKVLMVLLLTVVFSFVKKAFGMFSHSQLPV